MSKKSKQTQTQQSRTVTTPTNPEWVTSGMQGLNDKIANYGNLDPYSLVAGPDPLQTQAAQGAAGLGVDRAQFDALNGQAAPQVQASSLLDGLGGYMSPYTNDVVNTTLAGFDTNAGRTRAQQTLDIAGQGAFGGSGAALTRSLTEADMGQRRAMTEAGLRDQAFNTGAGLSNMDAGRRQDASSQNAQLSLQDRMAKIQSLFDINNSNRTDVAMQGDLGAQLQQLAQARAQAPTNQLINQAGLFGSLPLNLLHGQTQDSNGTTTTTSQESNPMGALGSLAMLAAAPFTGGTSLLGGLGKLTGVMGRGGLFDQLPRGFSGAPLVGG